MTLSRPFTQASRNWATVRENDPKLIRSSTVKGSLANFRMVRNGPPMASGAITAFTREPSGRRASTIGFDSSTRRPTWATIFSMIRLRWFSSMNDAADLTIFPLRSTKTLFGPLTMTSLTSGSASSPLIGP